MQSLYDDENEYIGKDDDFPEKDQYKSFLELIQDEITSQNLHRQPYIQAIELLNVNLSPESTFNVNETETDCGDSILMKLVKIGRLDLVKTLVESGANVNYQTENGEFALLYAAKTGWKEIFDYLEPLTNAELHRYAEAELSKGLLQRQKLENYAVSAFVYAATCGNLQAVAEAIANGIDINAINYYGYNALHRACWQGQTLMVEVLLKAGANPNISTEDNQGYSPLMLALDNPPFKVEIFRILLDAGADVNCRSSDNITVLMMAVDCHNLEAVQLLIAAGSDVNQKGYGELTPLTIAQTNNHHMSSELSLEIINLLLTAGAIN
ncbi:ankyrin repeat domain-containing protein [Nostoc sp. CMAA1605]|uniref:ankyrin repeat domain-containing protein n=1 Tax=Nostoc sp. CMAA1605 TaxID=2055159 RepID=UPI001F183813|nr:ankyrin repeat domain-containing protein [Nostoc sp. CMAA1605]